MEKFIKENVKMLFQTIIIILITSVISVSAANKMNANSIAYANSSKVGSVQEALDTLYNSIDVATITPVGSVLPYMGITAPENYLICDGSVYNIVDYQKLAEHIKNNFGSYNYFGGDGETTFAVPDLRGEFLRGAGTNSHANQGSGASVGEHQDGTEHIHILSNSTYKHYVYWDSSLKAQKNQDSLIKSSSANPGKQSSTAQVDTSDLPVDSTIRYTSRPTNTSVNYIIKVK